MIEQLRKIFSSLILYQDAAEDEKEKYQWFWTAENNLIGIAEQELTAKESQLLGSVLIPHTLSVPAMTLEEESWYNCIHCDNTSHATSLTYRFIHFSFKREQMDPSSFKEALNEFFGKLVPVLWENDHEGVIIEENEDEFISYEVIIDIFMSDLSVNIHFFVGPFMHSLGEAAKGYQMLLTGTHIARKYSEKAVITYIEAIPYILIDQSSDDIHADYVHAVLADAAGDDDLLTTIETFITCNLNVSVTAKELYLHRNSLQYRLEKFKDKTGVDVRDFRQAVSVYIALLSLQ
ncbi:PucR family transcriptional regulator [Lentibacillus jeotgali]|uniref:PucR family transcriptional regulator n=1 Tax=Lentibacillus jeotgali TaxID=558169 RepID=UPI0002FC410D|nr:helix-turn-helix domain-containing protein [Lentibacillus jeotgali]